MRTTDTNSAELIVRCKRQLTLVEECSAKGIDERAAYEIATLAGISQLLHWTAEKEYAAAFVARNKRELEQRKRISEAA